MTTLWKDQVALVTGGARGIGRAAVRRLVAQGCAVAINYTSRPDAAEELAAEIRAAGGRAITAGADVADEAAVRAMAARAEAELGPVTILVNNAGIAWPATLDSWEPKGFARLRAVNVDGIIHGVRAVMGGMKARGYGRIVNISSVASFGNTGFVGNHFYASTKAEVNAVAPGLTRSDMTQGGRSPEEWAQVRDSFAKITILGRPGEPEEIAAAIAFLASPEASFITAQVLTADGGRTDYIGH
jgi:3-oxoacyl-[acyl-carrier protein] reductase